MNSIIAFAQNNPWTTVMATMLLLFIWLGFRSDQQKDQVLETLHLFEGPLSVAELTAVTGIRRGSVYALAFSLVDDRFVKEAEKVFRKPDQNLVIQRKAFQITKEGSEYLTSKS